MIDKRRYPRHKARLLVAYKSLEDPLAKWHENPRVENISLGGFFFDAYEKLKPQDMFLFRIQIVAGDVDAETIEVQGKVVGAEDGILSFPTRVAFLEVKGSIKGKLSKLIDYIKE